MGIAAISQGSFQYKGQIVEWRTDGDEVLCEGLLIGWLETDCSNCKKKKRLVPNLENFTWLPPALVHRPILVQSNDDVNHVVRMMVNAVNHERIRERRQRYRR